MKSISAGLSFQQEKNVCENPSLSGLSAVMMCGLSALQAISGDVFEHLPEIFEADTNQKWILDLPGCSAHNNISSKVGRKIKAVVRRSGADIKLER